MISKKIIINSKFVDTPHTRVITRNRFQNDCYRLYGLDSHSIEK